jgi:hypothetical protein
MNIRKLRTDNARAKMKEKFDATFAGAPEGEVVVILEPMDTSFFGKHESSRYDLTASAIVRADRREGLYVAMCVFDDISVVALYDQAFDLHAAQHENEKRSAGPHPRFGQQAPSLGSKVA